MSNLPKRPVRPRKVVNAAPAAVTTADLPELPQMYLSGQFARDIMVIPRSSSSIILACGHIGEEKKPVLVPFVEMQLQGVKQRDLEAEVQAEDVGALEIFSETLSLENTFWLVYDVMRDIRMAMGELKKVTGSPATFDNARIAHARHFANQIRIQADMCVALMDEFPNPPAEKTAAAEVPADRQAAPVIRRRKPVMRKRPG